LSQRERYPLSLQYKLQNAIVASLRRLPVEPLQITIAALDVERAVTVEKLLLEAA